MGFELESLVIAAQHVHDLVGHQILDRLTGGLEILAGIELVGMLVEDVRMVPVMAGRRSESMLILHTALRAALRSCSSGMPRHQASYRRIR